MAIKKSNKMRTNILVLLISLLSLISCEKIDKECPDCIYDMTKEFANDPICNTGSSVSVWLFQEEHVYVFVEGPCGPDLGAFVYDDNCESIGYLWGIAAITKIDGVEFYANATKLKTIWKQD